MNIKDIHLTEKYRGFDDVSSALLRQNSLDPNRFYKDFPDFNREYKEYGLLGFIDKFMPSLNKTDEFIEKINNNHGKHFCIIGDYDADGVFGTSIAVIALREIGEVCDFVIPDRHEDGYGMKIQTINRAIEKGAEVIITVDNGIGCKEAVDYALSKGLEVIITDHHLPGDSIPENVLIIDPKYNNDQFSDICGAYVIFKLMTDLLCQKGVNIFKLVDLAVFAGIATVSDMMPLVGENRLLLRNVFAYINMLKKNNRWGGRTLKVISGLGGKRFMKDPDKLADENLFGFYIGPTVNATGRVYGDPTQIVEEIINCNNMGVYIDKGFESTNIERKQHTRVLYNAHMPSDEPVSLEIIDPTEYEFQVSGLMGLLANKISDSENKPAIVGVRKEDMIEFSCRSIPGYSIYDGFCRVKEMYPEICLTGGGHAAALGMRFPTNNPSGMTESEIIMTLRETFNADFVENSTHIEKVVYSFREDQLDRIIDTLSKFRIFGNGVKPLKFIYSGKFNSYDAETKVACVGNLLFNMYLPKTTVVNGEDKTVIFTVSFEDIKGPLLRANFVDVQEEDEDA